MSFEREAINTETLPVQSNIPVMREERVVSPYSSESRFKKASIAVAEKAAIGQENIGSSAPAEPGKPEETVTLSPQMAALARKEQAFRQREQAFKTRQTEIDAKAAKLAKLEALEAKLAAKDYSGVEELVNYDDYTKYLIDKSNATDPTQKALLEMKAEVDGVKQAHQEDVDKRFKAAVEDRRNAVKTLVDSDVEFASLKKGGKVLQDAVVQHILDTWEHDNVELSPQQAAKEVREALKQKKSELDKLFEEQPAVDQVDQKKQLPPLKPNVKTLTNNMTTGGLKTPLKSFQGMSDGERWAEARRRAEEKLQTKG